MEAIEISEVAPPATTRLLSLDVFRGITIAGMLLVNDPGNWSAVYAPLEHSEWNGWTPTDFVFPFFMFIVGVAMTFSFGKLLARGVARSEIMVKSAKRAGILFLLGLLQHSFPWVGFDYGQLRIPGVLQRIAVAFLLATPLLLWVGRRGRAAVAAALLLGYWAAMRFVPVPGVGAGVWEPGKDLGSYIDRAIFTTSHLWSQSRTWDPEGLLSTLPSVATVLIGIFVGEWLRSRRGAREKVVGMLLAGVVLVAAGELWGLAFPINKKLWTSSFVLFTAGLAAVGLALCYWVVDMKGYRRWSLPFVILGLNAIATYWLAELMAGAMGMIQVGNTSLQGWIYERAFASWLAPLHASLGFAIVFVLFWMGVMWVFYKRGIFIKV
jgi:predicted acyltransferase